jgi:hypothetical protein
MTAFQRASALRQRTTPLAAFASRFCHSFGRVKSRAIGQSRQQVAIAENSHALQTISAFGLTPKKLAQRQGFR